MDKNLKPLLYETLVAQAIADALGYLVEFKDWSAIKDKYGEKGLEFSYINSVSKILSTDDTQMNIFCVQGLSNELEEHEIVDPTQAIYKEYVAWLSTQGFGGKEQSLLNEYKELYYRRAPGNTCLTALGSGKCGSIEEPINESKGCGGIMRTMPTAFFAQTMQDAFVWGAKQAAITHGQVLGYLSAGSYSAVAYQLIHNPQMSIVEAMENVKPILSNYKDGQEMIMVIDKTIAAIAIQKKFEHEDLNNMLGNGWVGEEAFALSMYLASKYQKYEDVVYYGINNNGDSDSIAMLGTGIWHLKNRKSEEFMQFAPKVDLQKCIQETVDYIIEIEYDSKKSLKI